MVNLQAWQDLTHDFAARNVTLIAVSKTKSASDIQELYDAGQRDFGENYVQELVEKQAIMPADIRWHFIGHLQSNKVKYIAPFVHLVHAVDNIRLLTELSKQAIKNGRIIDVLLQMHIADEETKFGMDASELTEVVDQYFAAQSTLSGIRICGLMGMATNTSDTAKVRAEFHGLNVLLRTLKTTRFSGHPEFCNCSMGMSGDYEMAIEEGSNMVRIGSLLFGSR